MRCCLLPSPSHAQSYSIDWFTIDGGGGTSTGGVYSVSGTIGQPDAGKMSGGNFTIDGGFWGIIAAVQTPGAPLLSIARTTTNTVAVSGRRLRRASRLQQNTNSVSSVNWSNVVTTIQDDGTTKTSSSIRRPGIGSIGFGSSNESLRSPEGHGFNLSLRRQLLRVAYHGERDVLAAGLAVQLIVVERAVGIFTLATGTNAGVLVEVVEIDNHPP